MFAFINLKPLRRKKLLKNREFVFTAIIFFLNFVLLLSFIPALAADEIPDPNLDKFRVKSLNLDVLDAERIYYTQSRIFVEKEIDNLHVFLKKRNAAVFQDREFARLLVDESNKVGADFKIVVGIMGAESGFCVAPYRKYNCFGFLNGVFYEDFMKAFKDIVPKVARIVAGYNWRTEELGQRYGAVNWQHWSDKVRSIALSI